MAISGGGIIYSDTYGFEQLEMIDCQIENNSAIARGGGLFISGDEMVLLVPLQIMMREMAVEFFLKRSYIFCFFKPV
ncbi:MAG: hypothetical protein R2764_07390 [Bacteroidales bacterium]